MSNPGEGSKYKKYFGPIHSSSQIVAFIYFSKDDLGGWARLDCLCSLDGLSLKVEKVGRKNLATIIQSMQEKAARQARSGGPIVEIPKQILPFATLLGDLRSRKILSSRVDLSSLDKTYESLPVPIDSGAPKTEDLTPAQLAQVYKIMHELNKKTGLSSTELSPEMSAPPLSESVQSNQSLPPGPPLTTSPSVSNPPFHDFVNVEGVDAVVKMEVGGSPLLEENKLLQQENLQLKADNSKLQRRIIVLESQPSGSSSQNDKLGKHLAEAIAVEVGEGLKKIQVELCPKLDHLVELPAQITTATDHISSNLISLQSTLREVHELLSNSYQTRNSPPSPDVECLESPISSYDDQSSSCGSSATLEQSVCVTPSSNATTYQRTLPPHQVPSAPSTLPPAPLSLNSPLHTAPNVVPQSLSSSLCSDGSDSLRPSPSQPLPPDVTDNSRPVDRHDDVSVHSDQRRHRYTFSSPDRTPGSSRSRSPRHTSPNRTDKRLSYQRFSSKNYISEPHSKTKLSSQTDYKRRDERRYYREKTEAKHDRNKPSNPDNVESTRPMFCVRCTSRNHLENHCTYLRYDCSYCLSQNRPQYARGHHNCIHDETDKERRSLILTFYGPEISNWY